ncbi:unnamed protein product [Dovyalis caffra]|uniref:Uncharacterized protein n=1 Tax=Dovyalis caffra TaxID=77055 RepID=A0AAV1SV33_9ROSI|nr:unnamed protein product [Dovyalis caffra]
MSCFQGTASALSMANSKESANIRNLMYSGKQALPLKTPVRRGGHRRLSSDPFAYIDVANASNIDYAAQDEYRYKNVMSIPSWGSQDFDYYKDVRQTSLHAELNMTKKKNRAWDSSLNAPNYPSGLSCARENAGLQIQDHHLPRGKQMVFRE